MAVEGEGVEYTVQLTLCNVTSCLGLNRGMYSDVKERVD